MLQSTKTGRTRDDEASQERPSWLPRPSARQLAAMRERAPGGGAELSLIAPSSEAAEPAAASTEGLSDFRSLADSIAEMRRRRRLPKSQPEAEPAPAAAKPRSWLDEVREDVERRRATRGEADDAEAAPSADAAEIARLTAMMETLQARVTRLEAENARLSSARLRLGGERPLLNLTAPARPAALPGAAPAAEAAPAAPATRESRLRDGAPAAASRRWAGTRTD